MDKNIKKSSSSSGMSRASLKRKKGMEKISSQRTKSLSNMLVGNDESRKKSNKSNNSDDDDDNNINSYVKSIKTSKIDTIKKKVIKKKKIPEVIIPSVDNLTILDILTLKEIHDIDSKTRAMMLLSTMIHPIERKEFYKDYFEKESLLCQVENNSKTELISSTFNRFKGLLTKKSLDNTIKEATLYYDVDVNISKYENGKLLNKNIINKRTNLNEDNNDPIQAKSKELLSNYSSGYTLQFLCPQKYFDNIWRFLSSLEHEFGTMVGCNAYLMPPGCQGFAPRFETTDNFIMQLEGSSRWRVYKCDKDKELPRYRSDKVITQLELPSATIDTVLKAGESIYIPKGWIYQEECCNGNHSLHLCVNTNSYNSMLEFMELIAPEALALTATTNIKLRQSLPQSIFEFMGVASSGTLVTICLFSNYLCNYLSIFLSENEEEDYRRTSFQNSIRKVFANVIENSIDMYDILKIVIYLFLNINIFLFK
jgi:hypothetical protein